MGKVAVVKKTKADSSSSSERHGYSHEGLEADLASVA